MSTVKPDTADTSFARIYEAYESRGLCFELKYMGRARGDFLEEMVPVSHGLLQSRSDGDLRGIILHCCVEWRGQAAAVGDANGSMVEFACDGLHCFEIG